MGGLVRTYHVSTYVYAYRERERERERERSSDVWKESLVFFCFTINSIRQQLILLFRSIRISSQ